jgi:hypothetical protein
MRWLGGSLRPNGGALMGKSRFDKGPDCRSERAALWPVEERQGRGALRDCDEVMIVMTCRF